MKIRRRMRFFFTVLCFVFFNKISNAQEAIVYKNTNKILTIGNQVLILEDKKNNLSTEEAFNSKLFIKSNILIPNFQISSSSFWIKFIVSNHTKLDHLSLELPYPTIDSVKLISVSLNGKLKIENTGEYVPYYLRPYKHQIYIFDLYIPPLKSQTYMIKVNASEQIQLPLKIGTERRILESLYNTDLIFGLYAGIIIVMFLYNLFIYFTIRDITYLYYVLYILSVGLTQACVQSYSTRFLYPDSMYLANLMILVFPVMAGIFAFLFAEKFLSVQRFAPNYIKVFNIFICLYIIIFIIGLSGYLRLSAQLVQITAGVASLFGFFIGYKIYKLGYKPALFYLVAWSIFLLSVIVFVLRNFNLLPYNTATYYSLQIGSALETLLLSFALADKINIYKKEKEESQAQAMASLQDKERIVSEQNVTLENKVKVRTTELTTTNTNLQKTLTDLKEAQAQLVEAEKMASLGQLTAGIAHEINNPINFVTANVGPLKRDMELLIDAVQNIENLSLTEGSVEEKQQQMEDYKEEIDFDYLKTEINYLLKGIHEGASRTADIVKGLKIFSRLDEGDLKKADINEGLESTLIIANNLIGKKIQVIKNFGDIPVIECYPGKLNQVFLNIISNAVFAISEKFGDKPGGILKITTECDTHKLFIKIEDNGTGMSEAIKNKIFEPFFTTKDVGVGTGLGMSIVHNTIKKHNGQIYLNSAEGVGTEFILELHLIFEENIADYQSEHN